MKKNILASLALMALCTAAPTALWAKAKATFRVHSLTTSSVTCPLGTDEQHPRFAWKMQGSGYGTAQSAYRLVMATSAKELAAGHYCYDTGTRRTQQSVEVTYDGAALQPSTRYYWQVTVWDKKGAAVTSEPSWFETGLMDSSWQGAKWIGSTLPRMSKYRTRYEVDYSFAFHPHASVSTFILGAKSADNYVFVTFDYTKSPVMRIGHVLDGKAVTDHTAAVDARTAKTARSAGHDVKVQVEGWQGYDLRVTLDGAPMKRVLADGDKSDAQVFHVANVLPSETNCNSRLYQIGYEQPKGHKVSYHDISISDFHWQHTLYTDPDMHVTDGSGAISLWQPGEGISAPMLRKQLSVSKPVASARIYATARGIYQMYVNGHRVGDGFFNPGWTDYRYRFMYNTFDITPLMRSGANTIGAVLGSGWYSGAMSEAQLNWSHQYGTRESLMALIRIDYTDGTHQFITTDDSWNCYDRGPIVANSLYNGEDYDARKEVSGWATPSFDDSRWGKAATLDAPSGQPAMQAYVGNMIRCDLTLTAKSVKKVGNAYIYDFGQNFTGIPHISGIRGKAGQQLTIHYAEMLYPDIIPDEPVEPYTKDIYEQRRGQMYLDNYRTALSTDHYTMRGDASGETFEPLLTYHGFRYLSIEGLDAPLPVESVQGKVLTSIGNPGSFYTTSNDKVNRLFDNIIWGQRSNFLTVPTDCPQRDERLGWTGDAQIFCRTAAYNMNVSAFFERWFNTLRDGQSADGLMQGFFPSLGVPPTGAAGPNDHGGLGAGGWADAMIIIPWQMYLQYGNTGLLSQNYQAMKRYMTALEKRGQNYLAPGDMFGDWLAPEYTDRGLISTAYWAYDSHLMQKIATALGHDDDAAHYGQMFKNIREAFCKEYFDSEGYTRYNDNGTVKRIDTQASYILPIYFGLLDGQLLDTAAKHLAAAVERNGRKLTTGFLGTPYICPVLSATGRSDLAYDLFTQEGYPSWLFPVLQGATTMWERWNSYTVKNGFGPVSMNSFNHYAYGAIEEWMMGNSLGIRSDEAQPGYKHFFIEPELSEKFSFISGGFDNMYGPIASKWQRGADGNVDFEFTVPANTTATLLLPAAYKLKVLEGKKGMGKMSVAGGKTSVSLVAGVYKIRATMPR